MAHGQHELPSLTITVVDPMRKQYHFQPNGDRFDAWDVHRLIELSAGLPEFDVDVDSISEVDTPYWSQPGAGPETVREIVTHMRLVVDVDTQYPIILAHDGRVMDGMHRVARALLEGRPTLAAVQFAAPIEPDYRSVAPDELPYD